MDSRRRRGALAVALVALASALGGAAPAGAAVTVGSDLANPPSGVSGCGGGPSVTCVIVQRTLPGRQTASPIPGVVTKVRVRGGSGSARARILRPGPSGYTFVRSS